MCFEGIARLSRGVWRRFVRGSREISLVPSLHRASTDALIIHLLIVHREFWAHKILFNLLPQFSRLGTQGPASFYVFCVVVCAFCMYLGGGSGCCFSSLSIMTCSSIVYYTSHVNKTYNVYTL